MHPKIAIRKQLEAAAKQTAAIDELRVLLVAARVDLAALDKKVDKLIAVLKEQAHGNRSG